MKLRAEESAGPTRRVRFTGRITGIGTTSGLRVVIGTWRRSPFGAFADVMVQTANGHRLLLAPSVDIAEFVAATYRFDEIRVTEVDARYDGDRLSLTTPELTVKGEVGRRTGWGSLLRMVPRRLAVDPAWLRVINPLAGVLHRGVRTVGAAQTGRREYYGVTDIHALLTATVRWQGLDAGDLAAISPPVTFGFSSVPALPSVVDVCTTVELPVDSAL
jgi:hypothetical protein